MRAIMNNRFAQNPQMSIPRTRFSMPFEWLGTIPRDKVVPIGLMEILPSDHVSWSANVFCRTMGMLKPIMDNMYLDLFAFFAPSRLLWDSEDPEEGSFSRMMGAKRNPDDSVDYELPYIDLNSTQIDENTMGQYFGIRIGYTGSDTRVNALPFRMYNMVIRDYFQATKLQEQPADNTGNGGPDDYADYPLFTRNKRFDLFTSCLLEPQEGDEITLDIGQSAPVFGTGYSLMLTDTLDPGASSSHYAALLQDSYLNTGNSHLLGVPGFNTTPANPLDTNDALGLPSKAQMDYNSYDYDGTGAYADLSEAVAAPINQLRHLIRMQAALELDNRAGNRLEELIYVRFGVMPLDGRIQKSEYLGGGTQIIHINPVVATSNYGETQGNLSANGACINRFRFSKSFTDHGYIMILANVRADIRYQQGIDKMFTRRDRFDFPEPVFMGEGDQPIYQEEIFATGISSEDKTVFGYNEYGAHYKYNKSIIVGEFNSEAAAPLHMWHLAQVFATAPELNEAFIQQDTPISRVSQVETDVQFKIDAYYNVEATRALPAYNIPGMGSRL